MTDNVRQCRTALEQIVKDAGYAYNFNVIHAALFNDIKKSELDFWLQKRGRLPFVTYQGGAMKAQVNIQMPLDAIAERFNVEQLAFDGLLWTKIKKGECL